jgi:DNA primase
LLEAVTHYNKALNEQAESYLAERGISRQVADQFLLGVVDEPINGHEGHTGWLSIPYVTALGSAVGVKFRRLDDGKPKYGAPTGQKAHLYNVSDITVDSPFLVVCEGELDTVIVSGVLGIPAVGVPGVAAWKPHFAKMMVGYDTVYIVGDNDVKEDGSNPGAEFARRVQSELTNGIIVSLPPQMDINEYYLAHGAEATIHLLGGKNV